jgi:hypothetical protein
MGWIIQCIGVSALFKYNFYTQYKNQSFCWVKALLQLQQRFYIASVQRRLNFHMGCLYTPHHYLPR